jgi:hypothetical protein
VVVAWRQVLKTSHDAVSLVVHRGYVWTGSMSSMRELSCGVVEVEVSLELWVAVSTKPRGPLGSKSVSEVERVAY